MNQLASRIARALFVVPYLAKHRDGVSVAKLAELVGISPRAMEKDIEQLQLVGRPEGAPDEYVTLDKQGRGPNARVTALTSAGLRRPPRITAREAAALIVGIAALKKTGIASFDAALAGAEKKIRRALRDGDAQRFEREARVVIAHGGFERKSVLELLARAQKERRVVALDYASLTGQRRRTLRVEPYGLLDNRGFWYLLGKSLTHGEQRVFVFKVERILGVELSDDRFVPPRDFDPRRSLAQTDDSFVAPLTKSKIRLRLGGRAARTWGRRWKGARQTQDGSKDGSQDGSIEIDFLDHPGVWLAAWVLQHGEDVTVVEPAILRERVAAMADKVARAHDGVD